MRFPSCPDRISSHGIFLYNVAGRKEENNDQGNNNNVKYDNKNDANNGQEVEFGKDSFLNFQLLAPNSKVNLGEKTTLRGQVVARKIEVGEGSIVSTQDFFTKESDPTKIVTDQGIKFVVNEIVVLFRDAATQADAQRVANLVGGRITGFVPTPPIYKIELLTNTIAEIKNAIQSIKNSDNPLVVGVGENLIFQ